MEQHSFDHVSLFKKEEDWALTPFGALSVAIKASDMAYWAPDNIHPLLRL